MPAGSRAVETNRILRLLLSPDPCPHDPVSDWFLADTIARRAGLQVVLRERGEGAPDGLREIWERRYREVEGGNLLRSQAIQELEGAFGRAGLPWIALKGADLLRRGIYRNGNRPMKDIDVLIPPGRMSPADAILEAAGFRYRGSTPGQRAYTRDAVTVELHDVLYPPPLPFAPPEGAVWRRASGVGELSEHALDSGDRITYLALHYYLEEVRRVRSWGLLRDLAATLRRGPEFDADALRSRLANDGMAVFLSRRITELRQVLDDPSWIPEPLRALESNTGWRARRGFVLCEREARRRLEADLAAESEPGLRLYLLFWAPLRHIPRLILGAGGRQGGGVTGRAGRLGRRFLLGK